MSEAFKGPGSAALGWWNTHISEAGGPSARGLAARLRRAAPMAALCEPAVIRLGQSVHLGAGQADRLIQLAVLLAEVRVHSNAPLAQRLGGDDPALSTLRFQRLMRAEGGEVTDLLRRAIAMVDRTCNVAALAGDILHWDAARPRWCFQYFGADAPVTVHEETIE